MKQIPLTQGKFATVDDEDYEFLNQWKWYLSNTGYAVRNENGKTISMQRVILSTPIGLHSDHIDHDRLNNCRMNLRVCLPRENKANRKKQDGISKYKGVTWHKHNSRWTAQIMANGRKIYLGSFSSEEDAAQAYNFAAAEYHGEFAHINKVAA